MKISAINTVQITTLCFLLGAAASQAQTNHLPSQDNPAPLPPGGGGGGGGGRGGRSARGGGGPENIRGVYKATVTPHWFDSDTKFWYMNSLRGGASEFILIDADKGTRQPAFDQAKLAASLSKAADHQYQSDHLPFTTIEFLDSGKSLKFEAADKTWKCDLSSYECTATAASTNQASLLPAPEDNTATELAEDDSIIPNEDGEFLSPQADTQALSPQQAARGGGRRNGGGGAGGGGGGRRGYGSRSEASPDGKWTAVVSNFNIYLQPAAGTGGEIQLSQDGVTNNFYSALSWAPDSKTLIAWRVEPGDDGQVYLVESSPPNGGRAILEERGYPQAGDEFTKFELNLFEIDANTNKQIKPEIERVEFDGGNRAPNLRWTKDGTRFNFEKLDRGHSRFRLVDVEAHTGAIRNIIDEKAKTFIWTMNTDAFRGQLRLTTYLQNSEEVIYESEQDGWRHLYLYDIKNAKLENQITKGEWLVRGVDQIDEEKRQIWFEANGIVPGEDPYYIHKMRVNFDGTGLTALDEGNGTHTNHYSPDKKYLIDTYSRLDLAPVNNLRRASDGSLVCKLEEADISELKETGWEPSETFVAKGRDGVTDIYGVIDRPRNFDPTKKYPIIEDIYAGPQGTPSTTVPIAFSGRNGHANYTANGFIVVKIDGMGTANRSKAFHDVCWHNLADAGFPDRILWMKAAGAKYPYMDTNRVGIFGTSAGGQNAAGAVIFHPEFYKVAVANCGCHDNRIDKSTWNEQWMGYMPHDKIYSKDPDNWFAQNSNIDNAYKLGSKLLLIVGELDHNVPPESTFRLAHALEDANKDFDLAVVQNADHGAASAPMGSGLQVNGAFAGRKTMDFFLLNLLGKAPPDRNSASN